MTDNVTKMPLSLMKLSVYFVKKLIVTKNCVTRTCLLKLSTVKNKLEQLSKVNSPKGETKRLNSKCFTVNRRALQQVPKNILITW